MYNYLKHVHEQLNKLSFGGQGLAWFISFKLSGLILSGTENVPAPFFTVILQFILSIIILIMGVWLIDNMLKTRNIDKTL
ncbi:hypothetical protein [Lactococcus allomyrinae]|uniref:Uncharacterized protein n=1 Tax=Lactococcus allomyrinae TaxID=2419773 RepID=A0A387BFG7_9LACT|nr:hypothetical protein [Lactococcus allomyrinae]AYF99855.1 hypothetical protein D7I46_01405 [Lactococcus allomyrinae]